MRLGRNLRRISVVALACALAGCSTLQRINPFSRDADGPDQANVPAASARVPVLAFDDVLKVSDALKGVDFYLPAAKPQADWPLPGGTPEQSIEHVEAAPSFAVAWKRGFGKGSDRRRHVTAPPVSAGGNIFVMDGAAEVSAISAASGGVVWRTDLNPRNRRDRIAFGGGLAVDGGRVYVTSGYRFVAALDAATGALLWRTDTRAPIHAAPTVAGGRLFAVTIDNELESFDAATGRAGWRYQALVEPARILAASSPAVSGDTVVAAFASGEVIALRAANGTELWNASLTRASRTTALSEIRDIAGRPIIYRGDVLAGSHSGAFAAIDIRTGATRWPEPLNITMMSSPWAAGDVVYVTSKAGEVACISRDNGQVYWIRNLNEGRRQTRRNRFGFEKIDRALWTGPMLASGRLIVASSDGMAVALDPKSGGVLSTIRVGSPVLIAPIAVNGRIYLVTDDAKLVAIG